MTDKSRVTESVVERKDFSSQSYGERAWEICRTTGLSPFEALERAIDGDRPIGRASWERPVSRPSFLRCTLEKLYA